MIMREWRGRVPHNKVNDYEAVLHASGLADYAATPGNRGVWLLLDRTGDTAEFTTLTLWDSLEAIQAFAGDDISLARYYPEDDEFLLEKAKHVRHYDMRWTASQVSEM